MMDFLFKPYGEQNYKWFIICLMIVIVDLEWMIIKDRSLFMLIVTILQSIVAYGYYFQYAEWKNSRNIK